MDDPTDIHAGSKKLLKWAGISGLVALATGAAARSLEREERRRRRTTSRRGNSGEFPSVHRNLDGSTHVLPDGREMLDSGWPHISRPGPIRRFMDPRIPGPGFIPEWRRVGVNPEDIIREREEEWYRANGYVQEGGQWVRRRRTPPQRRKRKSFWARLFT